jgi:transposase
LEEYEHKRALLLKVTGQVRELSRLKRYKDAMELLISIPGVGLITGMTFLTEIGDIKRFKSPDQLASFLGLVPSTHSSGSKERVGHMTKRFNRYLRSLLIECAWCLVRSDPSMGLKYAELKKRMKAQKAIVRIAKKLVLRARAMLLTGTYYELGVK